MIIPDQFLRFSWDKVMECQENEDIDPTYVEIVDNDDVNVDKVSHIDYVDVDRESQADGGTYIHLPDIAVSNAVDHRSSLHDDDRRYAKLATRKEDIKCKNLIFWNQS